MTDDLPEEFLNSYKFVVRRDTISIVHVPCNKTIRKDLKEVYVREDTSQISWAALGHNDCSGVLGGEADD